MAISEYAEIKRSIRQLKGVCRRIKPLRMGVACMSKINELESDIIKELKKK